MGFLKKITKSVKKAYNGTIGDFINPSNAIVREVTGLDNTQQLSIGALGGATSLLGSLGGDSNSGILGTIFGSGENSLSGILGSVVKGAVGIGTSYFENQQFLKDQKELNKQKFGYDRQLADEAYQRDVAMWNLQNAYNAPAAQMQRLEQAGLNKNLVYGSGNVTGNTAGSPPSYPQVTYPDSRAQKLDLMRNVLGIFDQYQQIKNQALDNQRQNARLALQAQAMQMQADRSDRQYQLALANLGLRQKQFEYLKEQPKTSLGKGFHDLFNLFSSYDGDGSTYPDILDF